jgi:hypothetical protein
LCQALNEHIEDADGGYDVPETYWPAPAKPAQGEDESLWGSARVPADPCELGWNTQLGSSGRTQDSRTPRFTRCLEPCSDAHTDSGSN